MFQRRRSPRAAAGLARAAAGLAFAGPATAFATSGHHQAPRHNSDQQNNGHHGPQREDVSLNQVDLASDAPGMNQSPGSSSPTPATTRSGLAGLDKARALEDLTWLLFAAAQDGAPFFYRFAAPGAL